MLSQAQKEQVRDAVNFLVTAPSYSKLINEITSIIEQWDEHPMAYAGRLECLNALVDIGLKNRVALDSLLKVVETKRKLIPQVKRVDYQRDLMRERRARERKAIELHELTHGSMDAKQRKAHAKEVRARWAKARDEFIAAKGDLSWAERHEAAAEFWAGIDKNLDENLKARRPKG